MLLANFNGKEHLRHRAVSLRQHGFLVYLCFDYLIICCFRLIPISLCRFIANTSDHCLGRATLPFSRTPVGLSLPIHVHHVWLQYIKQEAKLSLGWPTVLPHSKLVISDCWAITFPAVVEILGSKRIGVTSLTFQVMWRWRHWSHGHSIRHRPFPIGVPLKPSLYL